MALYFSPEHWNPIDGFWSRFWQCFERRSTATTVQDPPLDASVIKFTKEDLDERQAVGVVYLVVNDYHAEGNMALRDYGKDFERMKAFFERCTDVYIVESHSSATATKFLATCRFLAEFKDYPKRCDRIFIYFAGHGKDRYILMEKDYTSPNISRRNRESQVNEERKVTIEKILSIFRKNHINRENMSRILLLDACCSVEKTHEENKDVCSENELVACAGSATSGSLSKCCIGGYWTMELYNEFDLNPGCDIGTLLENVKETMNTRLYHSRKPGEDTHLFPTFENKLQRKISFINKGMTKGNIYSSYS